MASAAKVLSSVQAERADSVVAARAASRRARWGWLELVRDAIGGALLLAAWLALWTVTWAAVAGPLSPVRAAGAGRAQVSSSVEGV